MMFRVITLFTLLGSSLAELKGSTSVSNDALELTSGGVFGDMVGLFHNWMEEHEKLYESAEEKAKRLLIWVENHRLIEKHNNQEPPPNFFLGHNHFSDMTNEEYQEYNNLGAHSPGITYGDNMPKFQEDEESSSRILADLPDEVNWVKKGAVTSVKNQGKCGACWAFSTAASIEGALQIKTGELVDLSEQQLLDCDNKKEKGCKGGLMDNAYTFEKTQSGLCKYDDYPYKGEQETCRKCDAVKGTHVVGFVDAPKTEAGLMSSIAIQPTAVAIQANQLMFQFYRKGVFDHLCFQMVDHGVLAAGYGTDEKTGLKYWLVKNSWGEKWGEEGYIKIMRKSLSRLGRCGIQRLASRPILAK